MGNIIVIFLGLFGGNKMTIEKRKSDGAFIVSDIIDGYYTKRVFIGYTKRQAMKLFKRERKRK